MAICIIELLVEAPCQCSSPGGIQTVSPELINSGALFLKPIRPVPLMIYSVWPRGCVCHAVRDQVQKQL